MRNFRIVLLALAALTLAACSRMRDPLPMTGEREALVGTWVSKQAIPAEGKTVNVVLILDGDGAASYMSCMDHQTRSDSGSVSQGHSYQGARGGVVTAMSDKQLTLSVPMADSGLAVNFKLDIAGVPREEGGAWHWTVDGVSLRSSGPSLRSDHEQWPCWSDKPAGEADKPADESSKPGMRT